MADRPIIFSAPMVQALLAGRKTQTRRILKPQPELNEAGLWRFPPISHRIPKRNWKGFCQTDDDGLRFFIMTTRHAPYAHGDRLWTKETWRPEPGYSAWDLVVRYAADGTRIHYQDGEYDSDWNWPKAAARGNVSSLFQPRWASRLTLHVSGVRVERLQEISEEDARAEGVQAFGDHTAMVHTPKGTFYSTYRGCFAALWDSLHGPDAWASNPWVCAITFTVERANIDEARRA